MSKCEDTDILIRLNKARNLLAESVVEDDVMTIEQSLGRISLNDRIRAWLDNEFELMKIATKR